MMQLFPLRRLLWALFPLQHALFPLFPLVPPSRRIVSEGGVIRKEALQGQEMV